MAISDTSTDEIVNTVQDNCMRSFSQSIAKSASVFYCAGSVPIAEEGAFGRVKDAVCDLYVFSPTFSFLGGRVEFACVFGSIF